MIEDLVSLQEKFESIKKRGWIENMRKGTTGIGYTFETLLGKEEESFPIPDYGSIEIKTRYRNSKYSISLFNATPDGDFLFPMKRLYDKFAFPQNNNKNFRVFYANIVANAYTYAGHNYRFKLIVDRDNKLIRVIAFSKKTGIINPNISWSFDFLKEKIERKLKYLALVKADAYNEFEKQYLNYYEINFYMLKNFETFLSLIEDGTIKVIFMLGCYKTGPKKGQMNNHGCSFDIEENDLEKLFTKVC